MVDFKKKCTHAEVEIIRSITLSLHESNNPFSIFEVTFSSCAGGGGHRSRSAHGLDDWSVKSFGSHKVQEQNGAVSNPDHFSLVPFFIGTICTFCCFRMNTCSTQPTLLTDISLECLVCSMHVSVLLRFSLFVVHSISWNLELVLGRTWFFSVLIAFLVGLHILIVFLSNALGWNILVYAYQFRGYNSCNWCVILWPVVLGHQSFQGPVSPSPSFSSSSSSSPFFFIFYLYQKLGNELFWLVGMWSLQQIF